MVLCLSLIFSGRQNSCFDLKDIGSKMRVWFVDRPLYSSVLETCLCHLERLTDHGECALEIHRGGSKGGLGVLSSSQGCMFVCEFHVV